MFRKVLSAFFIGLSFGTMLSASFMSYHTIKAGSMAFIFLVAGMITADFSGPDDPVC